MNVKVFQYLGQLFSSSLVDVAETLSEITREECIYKPMQGKSTEIKMKLGEISWQTEEHVYVCFFIKLFLKYCSGTNNVF